MSSSGPEFNTEYHQIGRNHDPDEYDKAKEKPDEAKKPNLTIAEAAVRVNAPDLVSFLAKRSVSLVIRHLVHYESNTSGPPELVQNALFFYELNGARGGPDAFGLSYVDEETPMMRLAGYFEKAFSAVSVAQFSWVEMFRNQVAVSMHRVPESHISEYVYRESIHWISQRTIEELSSFVQWCLERIFAYLEIRQNEDLSAKSLVDIFMVLALVLRQRPYILVHTLPTLRETAKYQEQDMLNVVTWMIVKAYPEDLAVVLYSWAHNLLPLWHENRSNLVLKDNILRIIESILYRSYRSDGRCIFESGTLRTGERLIPPSAIDMLIKFPYPQPSHKDYWTENKFGDIFFLLIRVAFTGSKPLKEARQMLSVAIKTAEENNDMRSNAAVDICTRCLFHDVECYKIWDEIYEENIKGSVCVLKHISNPIYWEDYRVKLAPFDALRQTFTSFRQKNEAAIAKGKKVALFQEADKYCEVILRKSYCSWFSTDFLYMLPLLTLLVTLIVVLIVDRAK